MVAPDTVTLITTLKNERRHLDRWLEGLAAQTRLPDDIVLVDGGSTDGTWEALCAWTSPVPSTVIRVPGASIASGRNAAFERVTGSIIAITDCGTVAEPDWLEKIVQPFDDPSVDIVGGFFVPEQETTVWQRALAAATIPDVSEISPDDFMPSSRSVAVRATWVRLGFEYPEWLDYCEDLIWDMRLKEAGVRFRFEPTAIVRFAGRPDIASFCRQYYRYARGDGKAGLFGKRHAIRYVTYAGALIVALQRNRVPLAVMTCLSCVYVTVPLMRLWRRDRSERRSVPTTATAAVLVPIIRLAGDLAKMAGYPAGVLWRLRTFGSLGPWKNWRRITNDGALWQPSRRGEAPQRRAD